MRKNMPAADSAQDPRVPDELLPESGLRAALEQLRLIAAQSRLLALNAAFESAGAAADSSLIREMAILAADADRAAAQAGTVEMFLR